MIKVLFLDVDGVLNSADWFIQLDPMGRVEAPGLRPQHTIDPKAVRRVQRIIKATGCFLVLSSTWRYMPELVEVLERQLGVSFYGKTEKTAHGHRGTEILEWLAAHPEVECFAIVDDDSDAGEGPGLKERFVRPRWKHGLYGKHEKQLIALLGEDNG